MITIGNPKTIAFEIRPDDLTSELAEVHFIVAERRVSCRNPVFTPTFAAELSAFNDVHKKKRISKDFSRLTYHDVFCFFQHITEIGQEHEGITPGTIWDYHRLHSLDDAIDDWEIYVFDTEGKKNMVFSKLPELTQSENDNREVFGITLPRSEFTETLTQCVNILREPK